MLNLTNIIADLEHLDNLIVINNCLQQLFGIKFKEVQIEHEGLLVEVINKEDTKVIYVYNNTNKKLNTYTFEGDFLTDGLINVYYTKDTISKYYNLTELENIEYFRFKNKIISVDNYNLGIQVISNNY